MTILNLAIDTVDTDTFAASTGINTALALQGLFKSLAAGSRTKPATLTIQTTPVAASGTWTTSSGSGTQTCVISGVSISITWATDDTVSAALMATAINASANALVAGVVTATSALGVVTITAVQKGLSANGITTTATGTGATAQQARLTGGTVGTALSFTF